MPTTGPPRDLMPLWRARRQFCPPKDRCSHGPQHRRTTNALPMATRRERSRHASRHIDGCRIRYITAARQLDNSCLPAMEMVGHLGPGA
eukprot:3211392-Pyramimonas_sp.AAC.1